MSISVKIMFSLFLLNLLSGCASTSRPYKMGTSDGNSIEYQVKSTKGTFSDELYLYANGELIAESSLSVINTHTYIEIMHLGRKVELDCSAFSSGGFMSGTRCLLNIDGIQKIEFQL